MTRVRRQEGELEQGSWRLWRIALKSHQMMALIRKSTWCLENSASGQDPWTEVAWGTASLVKGLKCESVNDLTSESGDKLDKWPKGSRFFEKKRLEVVLTMMSWDLLKHVHCLFKTLTAAAIAMVWMAKKSWRHGNCDITWIRLSYIHCSCPSTDGYIYPF